MSLRRVLAIMSIGIVITLTGCSKHEVVEPIYPAGISSNDYTGKKYVINNNPLSEEYLNAINNFTIESSIKLLDPDNISNQLYSPISLYVALALVASGAKNETQSEILSVLGMEQIEQLEEQTGNLYRLLYTDNEIGKLKLANSLWLDKDISFNQEYLDTVKNDYYASLFSVDFSKEETGKLISEWISENTNGTLKGSFPVSDNQIMSIINTVYFYDEWINKFDEDQTKVDTFHINDESIIDVYFMNKTFGSHQFIEGDDFISTSLSFKNRGSMNFYLPNEGVDVYDLLSTPEKLNALLDRKYPSNVIKNGKVIFSVPKFNYEVTTNLYESLKKLGIVEAFEDDADFSGITEDIAYISNITQKSHISIDEIGCEASSFTQIMYVGSSEPVDNAKIILNRPFLYTITSRDGIILYIGIYNNPLTITFT